jgi:hypothetical protein
MVLIWPRNLGLFRGGGLNGFDRLRHRGFGNPSIDVSTAIPDETGVEPDRHQLASAFCALNSFCAAPDTARDIAARVQKVRTKVVLHDGSVADTLRHSRVLKGPAKILAYIYLCPDNRKLFIH